MTGRAKLVAQGVAVAVVAGLLAVLGWRLATQDTSPLRGTAPDFTLPRLDTAGDLHLVSLRGKAVVMNFWASWCIPCKQEAPVLQAAWKRWSAQGLVVLGVDAEDFSGDARSFMRRYGVSYPVVRDGPGKVKGTYRVDGFPETYFVDRKGTIVGDHVKGPVTSEVLERNVRLALGS